MALSDQQVREFVAGFDGDVESAIKALNDFKSNDDQRRKQNVDNPYSRNEVILSVDQAVKRFAQGRHTTTVLDGISLDVHRGEFVALTGPSGSGKSTLLQIMGGLDRLTAGDVTIEGQRLNELKDDRLAEFRNRTIGFVFQFFYLQPFLPLNKNVAVPGMFGRTDHKEREARVRELLEAVGLSEQAKRLPKQLSGGQIQRAAIARALLNSPKVILADEPTGNLDSTNSNGIIELFKHIRETFGTTVVIVTHNPEIAASADREIRIRDGALA